MADRQAMMSVLNQLYAQRKVTLRFESEKDREDFRQSLYKLKRIQDLAAFNVLDEAKQTLRCVFAGSLVKEDCYAIFWLENKKEISFEIISVEENPVKEGNDGRSEKKVSASLGQADERSEESSQGKDNFGKNDEKNKESIVERERPG